MLNTNTGVTNMKLTKLQLKEKMISDMKKLQNLLDYLMKAKDRDYTLEEKISKEMVKVSRDYNMEMLRRVK